MKGKSAKRLTSAYHTTAVTLSLAADWANVSYCITASAQNVVCFGAHFPEIFVVLTAPRLPPPCLACQVPPILVLSMGPLIDDAMPLPVTCRRRVLLFDLVENRFRNNCRIWPSLFLLRYYYRWVFPCATRPRPIALKFWLNKGKKAQFTVKRNQFDRRIHLYSPAR